MIQVSIIPIDSSFDQITVNLDGIVRGVPENVAVATVSHARAAQRLADLVADAQRLVDARRRSGLSA